MDRRRNGFQIHYGRRTGKEIMYFKTQLLSSLYLRILVKSFIAEFIQQIYLNMKYEYIKFILLGNPGVHNV